MRKLRTVLVLTAAVAVGALAATAAHAVLTGRSGTFSERQTYIHETAAWSTGAAAFVNVPGATRTVTVPSGTVRFLDARFTAESQCAGTAGWCPLRIVVVFPSGGVVEMDPASGVDFAFDSGPDRWESHAIERTSRLLGAGTYRVLVQAGVWAGATSLRLDDWTLAVETVRP